MTKLIAGALAILLLAGCATTPKLTHIDAPSLNEASSGALKIDDIIEYFACDLRRSSALRQALVKDDYIIKVNLTVEVDDQFDVLPSLTWQNPLKPTFSFSTVASGDLGFQRQKNFTALYNLDGWALLSKPDWVDLPKGQKKDLLGPEATVPTINKQPQKTRRLSKGLMPDSAPADSEKCGDYTKSGREAYTLTSDLALDKVVRDGMGVVQKTAYQGALASGSDTAANFGTQVKFIITKSLTGLGPQYSLKYFKGPSSSAGLVTGKIVDTDTVIFTFTRVFAPKEDKVAAATAASLAAIEEILRSMADRKATLNEGVASAQKDARSAETQLAQLPNTLRAQPHKNFFSFPLPSGNTISDARATINKTLGSQAQQARARADTLSAQRDDLDRDYASVQAAKAQLAAASRAQPDNEDQKAAAAAAGNSQLNNILLQNLSSLANIPH